VSNDPIEIVRASYEAINNLDFDTVLNVVDPDVVVIDASRPDPSSPDGVWRGKEGWGRFLLDWAESFDETRYEAVEVFSIGNVVVSEVLVRGRGRGSGIPVENKRFHVFTFREGKGIRLEVCAERGEAVSAAKAAAGALS
jgi:ketosteroid isomerase-like protein